MYKVIIERPEKKDLIIENVVNYGMTEHGFFYAEITLENHLMFSAWPFHSFERVNVLIPKDKIRKENK